MRRVVPGLVLLVLVSYLAWDFAERRSLAADIDAIAARGEPVTVVDYTPGADTPERHDAARIYAAALARVRALPQEVTYRLPRLDIDNPSGPGLDVAELERIYRPDAPALQLLDQAAPLDFNGFGDLEDGIAEGSFTTLGYLAGTRADLLSARGKGDEAALAIVPAVRFWRAATPFARPIVTGRIAGSVRILLRHTAPGRPALETLQQAIEGLPQSDDLERQILLRRARFIDDMSAPRSTLSEAILVRVARPWIARRQRRALASFAPTLSIAREEWPAKFARWTALEEQYAPLFKRTGRPSFVDRLVPGEWLGVMSMPVSIITTGRDIALRRCMVATLAVERYRRDNGGRVPASLAVLVPRYLSAVPMDPFSGLSLVYKAADDGYVVYSVDDNVRNDGGKLYGFGSGAQIAPRAREPHDLGIAVQVRQ